MGKSRSATIILAYLLRSSRQRCRNQPPPDPNAESVRIQLMPHTPISALELLRRGRSLAEPNEGFMEQLNLYDAMGCPDETLLQELKYQRWLYKRKVRESLMVGTAPETEHIRFEDEYDTPSPTDGGCKVTVPIEEHGPSANIIDSEPDKSAHKRELDIKCRKCRHLLAKSQFIYEHTASLQGTNTSCAHIFLHPLSWMKDSLASGALDGRLTCPNPKCNANIGRFAWQGLRCSCGGWVTPGFSVDKSRVDESAVLSKKGRDAVLAVVGGRPRASSGSGDGVETGEGTVRHSPNVLRKNNL